MSFHLEIFKELIKSLSNNYTDNWDHVRFGAEPKETNKLKYRVKEHLNKFGLIRKNDLLDLSTTVEKESIHYEFLHNNLEDTQSKDLLIKIFLYRLLGHKKVKLPLSTPQYWKDFRRVEQLADKQSEIDAKFNNFKLYRFELIELGYPLSLYFTSFGVLTDFIVKQYELTHNGYVIKALPGDVVIDGGGCWGDTALYFANEVGQTGKVYSFEFIPFNLKLYRRNVELNRNLADLIEIVPHPLWQKSEMELYMKDQGPASQIKMESFDGQTGKVSSISIDDFVKQKQLTRLDFIKLDVEGAELMALRGTENSLKRFKPNLAVALYHRKEDFNSIPQYIESLNLGYRFFLSHCTIHQEETILFATARL